MPEPLQHPEKLPFEPTGPGFTMPDQIRSNGPIRSLLLSPHNIAALRKNRPDMFESAVFALRQIVPEAGRDPKTGAMKKGWTEQEIERLAALSVFVQLGVVTK